MRNAPYYVTYICLLIIGVLLLAFHSTTNLFEIMVVVIGVCLLIPSIITLFAGFNGKRMPDGTRARRPWYLAASAIAGLIGGTLLVVMPGFFVTYIIYTLAILLIVVGIIQILNLSGEGREIGGMPAGWYTMPWLTVIAGIVILIIGPDRLADIITIITGAVLTLYGINGLMSAAARRRIAKAQTRNQAEAEGMAEAEMAEAKEAEPHEEETKAAKAREQEIKENATDESDNGGAHE